ncbi:MAG: type II toxin-antitoxin system HicA family toxin [Chloroflexota bacterium]
MPKLRRLSGDEVISALARFGFKVQSQRGSHAKLRRTTAAGVVQTLTVPRHRELDPGTLVAILRQASRFVPEEQLREQFYSD